MILSQYYDLEKAANNPFWCMVGIAQHPVFGRCTNRQMAILLLVKYSRAQHGRTVRALAQALGVRKPIITRAFTTLQTMNLGRRVKDDNDRRNIFFALTEKCELELGALLQQKKAA